MRKRITPIENLVFIALMASINAILGLLTHFLPVVSLFIILLMPLISALTVVFCKARYLPIYFITSLLVCFFINFSAPENIIFSLLPSLISGSIIGVMIKLRANAQYTILLTTIAQALFTLATIPLIKAIYQVDMFEVYCTLLSLKTIEIGQLTFLPLVYVLSLIQSLFTLFICANELRKVNVIYSLELGATYISSIISLVFFLLSIGMFYAYLPLAYLFFAISITSGFFSIVRLFNKSFKTVLIILGVELLFFIFAFALLYSHIDPKMIALLGSIIFIPVTILDIILALLEKYLTTLKKVG